MITMEYIFYPWVLSLKSDNNIPCSRMFVTINIQGNQPPLIYPFLVYYRDNYNIISGDNYVPSLSLGVNMFYYTLSH